MCERDQLAESAYCPIEDMVSFPDIQEKASFHNMSKRLKKILSETKHIYVEYQNYLKTNYKLDDERKQWVKRNAPQGPTLSRGPLDAPHGTPKK